MPTSPETLLEIFVMLGFAIGSFGFTVAGLVIERAAMAHIAAGDLTFGLWEAAFGLLLLYTGLYAFGYRGVWQRSRSILNSA